MFRVGVEAQLQQHMDDGKGFFLHFSFVNVCHAAVCVFFLKYIYVCTFRDLLWLCYDYWGGSRMSLFPFFLYTVPGEVMGGLPFSFSR